MAPAASPVPASAGSAGSKWDPSGNRICGVPGCTLLDFHLGLCSTTLPDRRREHKVSLSYNELEAQKLVRQRGLPVQPAVKRERGPRTVSEPRPVSPPPEQRVLPGGLHLDGDAD